MAESTLMPNCPWCREGRKKVEVMSNELLMQAFMADVEHELNHARQKYPDWPSSPQKAVGVLMKQAGMLTVVAYDLEHKPGDRIECLADMRKYTARTAAMAYRVMNGCGQ